MEKMWPLTVFKLVISTHRAKMYIFYIYLFTDVNVDVCAVGLQEYLRWRCRCLWPASSWPCRRRRTRRTGAAGFRTAPGRGTRRWRLCRRCPSLCTGWRTRPLPRCRCRSGPSQTWNQNTVTVSLNGGRTPVDDVMTSEPSDRLTGK